MNSFIIVITIIGFLGLALFLDARKKKLQTSSKTSRKTLNNAESNLTADEAQPTNTGRFRVREMLRKTDDTQVKTDESDPKENANNNIIDSPLPDPFDKQQRPFDK